MATYNIDSLPIRFAVGDIINCPYSGSEKNIMLPKGSYTLQCWGGKGGNGNNNNYTQSGGEGGYTSGTYSLSKASVLYLTSGGKGSDVSSTSSTSSVYTGGFNGGGSGAHTYAKFIFNYSANGGCGGGATHIATASGLLSALSGNKSSIIMVAGGGGGGACSGTAFGVNGGRGGATTGESGDYDGSAAATGGTQNGGGTGGYNESSYANSGSFGAGGNAVTYKDCEAGGGGGYYGGGAGRRGGGAGGSNYISASISSGSTNRGYTTSNPDSSYNGYIRITVNSVDYYNDYCRPITASYGSNQVICDESYSTFDGLEIRHSSLIRTLQRGQSVELATSGKLCDNNITLSDGNLLGRILSTEGKIMNNNITVSVGNDIEFVPGAGLSHSSSGTVESKCSGGCITGYIPVPEGCTNVTIYTGSAFSGYDCLQEFDAEKNYLSYWGASSATRTFTFDYGTQVKYIRCTFSSELFDSCYVYDNTNGQYIFKGSNVV